jgi:dTDP-4-amino-4,6-dideoxygalactose transaminase
MSVPFLPFALPDIGQAEIDEVVDALRSGWVTSGPKVTAFERAFRELVGVPEAIAVSSATAGLHLALEALGLGPRDEILVPVHTFTATAEVVAYLGATPVFVDVEAETLNIDPVRAAEAVTDRTRAILPVHFAGLAADMGVLLALARRHRLKIVEDAAHALPATYRGDPTARSRAMPPCSASTPPRRSRPGKVAWWRPAPRSWHGASAPCGFTASTAMSTIDIGATARDGATTSSRPASSTI